MIPSDRLNRILLPVLGIGLISLALAIPNTAYVRLLAGDGAKDLSWGAPLFRALLSYHGCLLVAIGLYLGKFRKKALRAGETNRPNEQRTSTVVLISLSALTVVAVGLRLPNLNSDLWVDEVLTLVDYARKPLGEILTSFPNQNQHMLYSILARGAFGIFGESPWALRLPALIFGTGSIWALFALGRRIIGIKQALFASALMTVSYHHIWFSQNARGYTGLLFFALLATWLWFEALEKNEWRWWLAYSAALTFGLYVHMTMAFVVAAHVSVYLILRQFPKFGGDDVGEIPPERRAGIKPIAAWFLSLTAIVQLYSLALPEFFRTALHEESRNSEWTNPLWVITETLQNLSIGFAGIAVVLAGIGFVFFGWIRIFSKNRRAALLMVLPAIFAGSSMLVLGHNLFPRFFFFSMGFGLLIVIHGLFEVPKVALSVLRVPRNRDFAADLAGVALSVLIIIASITTVPRNYALPKQDFQGARKFVEAHRQPDEAIVAVSIAGTMYERYFAPHWPVAKTGADLKEFQAKNEKSWLVYTLSPEIRAFHPDMWQMIESDYEVVKVFPGTLNGGEIVVCRKRVPGK
ncbi:MAG TPA: glycosyltransferase family 39 protein [Pyrinomonadaceae bacterium]|nr:glycosyltransferase family 39 protein [Pyrinomonadaceae bacterium]